MDFVYATLLVREEKTFRSLDVYPYKFDQHKRERKRKYYIKIGKIPFSYFLHIWLIREKKFVSIFCCGARGGKPEQYWDNLWKIYIFIPCFYFRFTVLWSFSKRKNMKYMNFWRVIAENFLLNLNFDSVLAVDFSGIPFQMYAIFFEVLKFMAIWINCFLHFFMKPYFIGFLVEILI